MITPIGIAIEGAQDKYKNFIKVIFNGEEIRIFNTEDIQVSDVLVLTGFNPRDLMPKRAEDFIYYINGKKRIVRGKDGKNPEIIVDGKIGNLKTNLKDHSIIEIIPGTIEPIDIPYLYDLVVKDKKILFEDKEINLIEKIRINGEIVENNIILSPEVKIEIEEIKTLSELLNKYDKNANVKEYLVNGNKSYKDYQLKKDDNIKKISVVKVEDEQTKDKNKIRLVINNDEMDIYYKKDKFIFVDIFDYIEFDRSSLKGKLILEINDREAEYMEELKDGDNIKVYWE